jgi:hypothetical protein
MSLHASVSNTKVVERITVGQLVVNGEVSITLDIRLLVQPSSRILHELDRVGAARGCLVFGDPDVLSEHVVGFLDVVGEGLDRGVARGPLPVDVDEVDLAVLAGVHEVREVFEADVVRVAVGDGGGADLDVLAAVGVHELLVLADGDVDRDAGTTLALSTVVY